MGAGGFRAASLGRRLRLGGEGLGHDVHALADGGDAGGQRAGVGVRGTDRERADVGAKRDRHRDEDAQDDGPEGEGGPSTDAGRGGALLVVAEVVVVAVIVVRRGGGAAGARLLHRRGGRDAPRGVHVRRRHAARWGEIRRARHHRGGRARREAVATLLTHASQDARAGRTGAHERVRDECARRASASKRKKTTTGRTTSCLNVGGRPKSRGNGP